MNVQVPEFIQAYTELVAPCTESPIIYHDWSILTAVGGMLGRRVWLEFGIDNIYPNMYTVLLGPAAGRKSAAINFARKMIEATGFKEFAKEKSSKEKFLADLANGFSKKKVQAPTDVEELLESEGDWDVLAPASQVLISAGELLDFLGPADLPFITLLTNLWDNLPKYEQPKLTGNNVYVHKPTVSLLGGATHTTFATVFPPEIIGGGMLSRTLIIKGDGRRGALTLPPPPDPVLLEVLHKLLCEVRLMNGAMTMSPQAMMLIDDIYKAQHPLEGTRFDTYVGRRHVQMYKLCVILTALQLEYVIQPETVVYANTILDDVERTLPTALGEFGLSLGNAQSNSIIRTLTAKPCNITELWTELASDFKNKAEFKECIEKLKSSGRLDVASGGQLYIKSVNKKLVLPHVDRSLLKYREQN